MPAPTEPHRRTLWVTAIVKLRWFVVIAWIAGTAAATMALPRPATSSNFAGLVPTASPAIRAEQASLKTFGYPLLTDTAVVVYDRAGIPGGVQSQLVSKAARIDRRLQQLRRQGLPSDQVIAALPLLNNVPGMPTARHPGTTAVTYLYFTQGTALANRERLASGYLKELHLPPGVHGWTSGVAPARVAESNLLTSHLQLVEIVTLVLVCLIVGITFRSVIAPLVTVATAIVTFLLAIRLLGVLAKATTLVLPSELEPLIVALVLGVLTDYSVLLFTGLRQRLRDGATVADATRRSYAKTLPIIAIAGLTVTAGTAALYSAPLRLYRVFGPGLAVSVLVSAIAALTFLPALTAILGTRVFWPSHHGARPRPQSERRPGWIVRAVSRRAGAAVTVVLVAGALGAVAYPVTKLSMDASFTRGLPASQPARAGADALTRGFARGILSPTVAVVRGPGLSRAGLTRLQGELSRQPGIAGVLGPGQPLLSSLPHLFVTRGAARFVLITRTDPLGGIAIRDLGRLQSRSHRLLTAAGLPGASVAYAGNTAVAANVSAETGHNLAVILATAFGVEFLILAGYLRALISPVALLAGSALVVAAALGLTTAVFQLGLHSEGLMFYAPFSTSVLLVALGSDYNVFVIGRIREETGERSLREALRVALPGSRRAIRTAGLTLAASFAAIAVIPLLSFREIAFTMFAGLLIDTFVVRSLLTPGLLTLLGPRLASWPGGLLRRRAAPVSPYGQPEPGESDAFRTGEWVEGDRVDGDHRTTS